MPMVQVFAPDGTLGDVPYDKLHDALAAGAKPAAKFKAPDGTVGYVPADKAADALKAGGQRVPLDLNDADGGKPDGFWQRLTAPTNPAVANSNPAVRFLDAAGGAALGTPQAIYNTVRHPIDTAQAAIQGVKGWADPNLTANAVKSVLPEALGQGVGNVAGGEVLGAAGGAAASATPSAADIGTALRTPEGKLIAPVKVASKVAGAAAGHALGVPGAGELGGYLIGDKLADMIIPDRPGAATAAERRAVPLTKSPYPENVAQINAARKATAQGVPLSDLANATAPPSGVTVVPEPRASFAGETPNYMASIPRDQLLKLAQGGKPGAGLQMQQLGQPVIYAPSGAGISNVKASIPLSELANPGDFTAGRSISKGEPNYLYRIRPVGEEGVPAGAANSPAQLTSSMDQAMNWWDAKNAEKPHEIIRVDANSLKPGQTTARPFSDSIDWHKVHQAIPESQVEVVVPHQVEAGND